MPLTKLPRNWKRLVVLTSMSLPGDFHQAVRMLTRPYYPISNDDALWLDDLSNGRGDIIQIQGCYMTWGIADGSYHLMNIAIS